MNLPTPGARDVKNQAKAEQAVIDIFEAVMPPDTGDQHLDRSGQPMPRAQYFRMLLRPDGTRVARHRIADRHPPYFDLEVSTAWLGEDRRWDLRDGEGPPLIFETRIFPKSPMLIESVLNDQQLPAEPEKMQADRVVVENMIGVIESAREDQGLPVEPEEMQLHRAVIENMMKLVKPIANNNGPLTATESEARQAHREMVEKMTGLMGDPVVTPIVSSGKRRHAKPHPRMSARRRAEAQRGLPPCASGTRYVPGRRGEPGLLVTWTWNPETRWFEIERRPDPVLPSLAGSVSRQSDR